MIQLARQQSHELETFQSNAEHELIGQVQTSKVRGIDFIVLNPGGLAYTSIALRDSFAAAEVPFIGVHLSNIFAREGFRSHSHFSGIAVGTICGLGAGVYELALRHIFKILAKKEARP